MTGPTIARSRWIDVRTMFVGYLAVIVVGLAYFLAIGLGRW
jgi:hypothetical protein